VSLTRPPGAVVIGGDYQGLATARSLGRYGVPVLVLDDERSIARYSNYVTAYARVPDLRSEGATVTALLDVARRHAVDGWLLFPTRDETVAEIAQNRETLSASYRVCVPAREVVDWAWDKRNTYRLAAELGLSAPRTWTLQRHEDLDAVDAPPPYVIKPAIKERFFYATGRKAWRADSPAELARCVDAARALIDVREVVVQELIPGPGAAQVSFCAFFARGGVRASMTAQRLRQHPPDFGRASTYAITLPDHPALTDASVRFLSAIDYYGLVELEYKFDARDGQFKLLDVNPRTWGYHGLGQAAGVDFPYHLYADQVGLPAPDAGRARPGVRWVRLATDLPTAAMQVARAELPWRATVRSLLRTDVGAVFSRDDPLPALAELALLPYLAVRRGL
jgi:D-aspartate ligase